MPGTNPEAKRRWYPAIGRSRSGTSHEGEAVLVSVMKEKRRLHGLRGMRRWHPDMRVTRLRHQA
ncbi:hypothetical protein LNKW23_03690 [Paralimibaculum aggregatum]|uniref:Uncharacterized protein n=1 Tax=Paralimibaculum aggregatum TaxID=3036245 RepID=A0ABQ6LHN7_9RHOB|nr:hypothetical protein LNKW23_03690 [Limibaculum sp. NKW23]